jgi:hypothetical protein
MTPVQRIRAYEAATGWLDTLWVHATSECILGHWVLGNDYRVKSGYHGGYPATYLRRIKALFPERQRALHLFSGKVDIEAFPGVTCDLNPALEPDYIDNAETLEKVPLYQFDIILADPPYTGEDADRYGTPMVNRGKVMQALTRVRAGAAVVWLDMTLPMYRKADWRVLARIGVTRSTNHRFRTVTVFERMGRSTEGDEL